MTADRIKAMEDALREMCEEFRGHDLPYGSKAYQKAIAALNASQPAPSVAVKDAASQAVQRAIDRLRSLNPSAGRPAWDEIVAEEMAGALRTLTVQDAARKLLDAEQEVADAAWFKGMTQTAFRSVLRAIAEGRA